jgi:aspartyl-tRNA synthetase
LGVLVPTNTKLTHVFGSKVLVCYKLTLTPPSKHGHSKQAGSRAVVAVEGVVRPPADAINTDMKTGAIEVLAVT